MQLNPFATCLLASVGGNISRLAFPGQQDYPALLSPYNFDLPTTPAAIVFPNDTTQVAAAVRCATDAELKVQPKSGGHNYGNYGSTTGQLSVNLALLDGFALDATTGLARLGPGNRLGRVTELMYAHGGRHAPHGETFTVGLGGHATVGGAGAASRQLGLLVDFVDEVEVVLANASVVRASADENPDLFFAVRGAGSSIGIVTEFAIRTVPAPNATVSYTFVWPNPDLDTQVAVFAAWQDLLMTGALPREMSSALVVTASSIVVSGVFFGTEAAFAALNLTGRLAPPSATTQLYTSFYEAAQAVDAAVTAAGIAEPSHFYAKSLVFRNATCIDADTAASMFSYLANTPNATELYTITFDALGGAVADVSSDATAYPHRDAVYEMFSFARTSSNLTATTVQFLDGLNTVLTSGQPDEYYGQYGGNVDPREELDVALAAYYGENLERLKQIKKAVDPTDVFHNQQSIPV